jgi:valyl-tRNA synthetase
MTNPPPHTELAKQYRPEDVESQVAQRWQDADAFHACPKADGKPYAIVIPPPNVTAALHMGHALNNTLQDILIRWHRMLGDNAMWMPGTDHAGIATQTVVDKRLQAEGKPALKDYKKIEADGGNGREQFIEKVQAWKDEYEGVITGQLKSMGCSCDWERQRFTMDPTCAKAVREAFFRLFKDGLIYRGKRLVNWDPATQTALADDEVESQDVDGHFYYMKYPVIDDAGKPTGEHVTVATTRPETMLGDTAVAVNPRDTKHSQFIGKRVALPIVGRHIPIIGDDYVVIPDPDSDDAKAKMASGFLKVTPAHDPNDWLIGQRHALNVINVMALDASISKDHGWDDFDHWQDQPTADKKTLNALLGQSREQARKSIVKWFEEHDLLEEIKPYRHAVGHSYRSHVPIEPYLSDQWYVKVTDDRLRGAAIDAMVSDQRDALSETYTYDRKLDREQTANDHPDKLRPEDADWHDQLHFYPERYARTFQHWHENLRDWCISRQLWWGHRIPVWGHRSLPGAVDADDIFEMYQTLMRWESEGRLSHQLRSENDPSLVDSSKGETDWKRRFICVRSEDDCEIVEFLERWGFTQDPDVLDTWFSSALWPMSTLGWPEDTPELATWNPSNVLCTAREIITLWVSRMVMFNTYLHGQLPFTDVFIHAMIQDGHGQKMSKSLGNGVDPNDIIHSHGSDAMRFTLTSMTTQTQDVRMPVDMVCPHTQKMFTPKFVITGAHQSKVAAPVQDSPFAKGKQMVSSFGLATGQAKPSDDAPLARNTSEKFDYGRNFANKLWNATRFALSKLEEAQAKEATGAGGGAGGTPNLPLGLADRWILSRTARTIEEVNTALENYDFHNYAGRLYQFVWNDVCDWYIEAVKPTISKAEGARSRQVLAVVLDVSLRMLHPSMPFITERLWESLSAVAPKRGVRGLDPMENELLVTADWPTVDRALVDLQAEENFERMRTLVTMIREVRTANKVPPRETVEVSVKLARELVGLVGPQQSLMESLGNVKIVAIDPDIEKPDNAAVIVRPLAEVFLHNQLDADAEKARLTKHLAEVSGQVKNLEGRLSNEKYTRKAPAHLVQESRDKLAGMIRERDAVKKQLEELG